MQKMTKYTEIAINDAATWENEYNEYNGHMPIFRKKNGKVFIISTHKDFSEELERFKEFFMKQGLVVKILDCPGKTEFVLSVLDFANSFEDYVSNCAVVVVLSHGKNGNILAADDKEMAVENDIMGRFNNKDCPALKGKPKFFLLHTILDEEEEEPYKRLYLRKKVKNALILQSAVKVRLMKKKLNFSYYILRNMIEPTL